MAMASGGRDLSIRMSAGAQNIDNSIERMALGLFKVHKVEISQAIRESYPFFELLRDHGFITSETYDVSKESFKKGHKVEEVVYNVLVEVEKKFDLLLLKVLFNKFILKSNPDLQHIYEIFKNEIPDKNFFPESDAEENKEMHDIQSSLEQVTISDDSAKGGDGDEPPKASTQAVKRKTGTGQQPDVPVNFQAEILPVNCEEKMGLLIKRKLERGATVKCIRYEDIHWFTLSEFGVREGYKTGDWKKNLLCGGRTLKDLMEDKTLPTPPKKHGPNKKGGNSDKCKICQDQGKLFPCKNCQSVFHADCHLPPVDTKRNDWNCTFCTIKNPLTSQQRYRESEVLEKVMGPEEQQKSEFLLLKVYGHLEGYVLPNIPRENYVEEASRCLENLRELDKIKECLIEGKYLDVKSFVLAMDGFFTIPSCNEAELTKDDFKKNFKDIFAIQETN